MSDFDKSNEGYCGACSRRLFFGPSGKIPEESYCAVCGKTVKILSRAGIYDRDILRLEAQLPKMADLFRLKIQSHMETRGSYDAATVKDILESLRRNVTNFEVHVSTYNEVGDAADDHLVYAKGEGADIIALVLMLVDKLERKKYAGLRADREAGKSSTE